MNEKASLKRKMSAGRGGKRGRKGEKRGRSLAGNITIREQPAKSKEELKEILLNEISSIGLVCLYIREN